MVNLYNANSNKLSVYNGGISLIGNSGEKIKNVIRKKQIMYFKYFIMPVNHPAFFVTKEVYKRYGTFNTDFKIAADYELILRFSKNKVNFCFFQDICTVVEPLGLSSYLSNNNELLKEGFLVRSLYLNLFNNKIIDFIIRIILSLSKYKHEYLNKLR